MLKFILYTKDAGVKTGTIEEDDVRSLLKLEEESFNKLIKVDPSNYKYGLSFNEYLYLWISNFSKSALLTQEEKKKSKEIVYKYLSNVQYVGTIDELVRQERCSSIDFNIDSSFLDALRSNMNLDYGLEEKVVYYYFKMCHLLNIDTVYNFCFLISRTCSMNLFRKSSNRLEKINCVNNEVSCFEFEAILNKLIQIEGGYAQSKIYKGDSEHVNTDAVMNRRFYRFDAFEDPLWAGRDVCDIKNVKINNGYGGIVADKDDLLGDTVTHVPFIDEIYQDVQREFALYPKKNKFNKDSLNYCLEIVDSLNIEEAKKNKIRKYFQLFNSYDLKSAEYYVHTLKRFSGMINNSDDNINLTGVCTAIDEYDLSLILSVRQKDYKMIYFMFGRNSNIDIFDAYDVRDLIEENKIIIQRREEYDFEKGKNNDIYKYIPGIDKELQKRMHGVAVSDLLPVVAKEHYLNSLCDKDSSFIKQKVY